LRKSLLLDMQTTPLFLKSAEAHAPCSAEMILRSTGNARGLADRVPQAGPREPVSLLHASVSSQWNLLPPAEEAL
jgi:hypothetical protein